ncbi:MAG: hypothetical protein TR69_WS6001000322 [candidate division WS6 bacterium OLB20]|uniref:ATP-grasp domain-containing protein n=1 Tax=candidate division WS6 bacterium OLB20 TaxID=1617426 RepID=A0A136M0M2_9BACT|nr:MAG: hypothetical protein TR69_WS6001000322 [candidate division WS6 bacterium OLB20]
MNSENLLMGHPGEGVFPLAHIGATLYLESGNEGRSENSDFNSMYELGHVLPASMQGKTCVLSARSYEHALRLKGNFANLAQRTSAVSLATGIPLPCIEPAIIVVSLDEQFDATATWNLYSSNPRRAAMLVRNMESLQVNQRTGLQLRIMEQIARTRDRMLYTNGAHELAALTGQLNNKQTYVEMMQGMNGELPAHVPTRLISINDLPGTFADLLDMLDLPAEWQPETGVILKSAIDAGSEVLSFVYPDSYEADVMSLVGQNQEKEQNAHRSIQNITLLAQPVIRVPADPDSLKSFGIMLRIGETPGIIAATSQIFNSQYYVGSYYEQAQQDEILSAVGSDRLTAFAEHMHAVSGYDGIAVFDGMNDIRFGPHLIYDGNFRQSAAFYALTVARFLREQDISVASAANIGYTGKLHCSDQQFLHQSLRRSGLLFTPQKRAGIIPLPNMNSSDGYDLVFINMSKSDITGSWEEVTRSADYTEVTDLHF